MKESSKKLLLKEYVKTVLSEDDMGFGGYGVDVYGAMGDSPYGMSWGGSGKFYKTFVEPFVDVFKVTKAEIDKTAVRARTGLKIGLEAIITTVIPFFDTDYNEIFKDQKKQLDAIQSKYKDVFDRVDKALMHNDFVITAFMLNPSAIITAGMIKKAPEAVMATIETLLGTNVPNSVSQYFNNLKRSYKDAMKEFELEKRSKSKRVSDSMIRNFGEVILESESSSNPTDVLINGLKNPEFLKYVTNSPLIKGIKNDVRKVILNTANELNKSVQEIMTVNSLEQLKSKIPNVDIGEFKDVPADQLAAAEKTILQQVKLAAKNFYKKKLESQIEEAKKMGLGEDSELISIYDKIAARLG